MFDIAEIWSHASFEAKIIIVTMIIMGLASIFVAIERTIALVRARNASRSLAGAIGQHFADGNASRTQVAEDEQFNRRTSPPSAGLKEFIARPNRHGVEAAERAIQRAHIDGICVAGSASWPPGATCRLSARRPFSVSSVPSRPSGGGDLTSCCCIGEAPIATAIGIRWPSSASASSTCSTGLWLASSRTYHVRARVMDWFEKQIIESAESAAK